MRSQKFIPIGIDLVNPEDEENNFYYPFTGTFDGQGFKILNLYLADYDYVSMVYSLDDTNFIDYPTIDYYSIFTSISSIGVIKNLMIVNPIFELLSTPEGLTKTAVLVGENFGLVYNASVIDTRVDTIGTNISGIRFNIQIGSSAMLDYSASGFVHTNYGKVYNSFYVSERVLVVGSSSRFDVRPFVFINDTNGIIENSAYDDMVEGSVNFPNQVLGVNSYSTVELKTGIPNDEYGEPLEDEQIILNNSFIEKGNDDSKWYYYHQDGYPTLVGLEYEEAGNYFKIKNEYDLLAFSELINKNTKFDGLAYNQHHYKILDNIDMKNISSYQTPATDFRGKLEGGTIDFTNSTVINDNKYISNLNITKPLIAGSNYYIGLTSTLSGTISNINFNNSKIILLDTSVYYGRIFYVGMLSAELKGGTIKNIVNKSTINLGTNAIGKSYAGGIIGYGFGKIDFVANSGNVDGGIHDFNNLTINATFYIGGIAGGSSGEGLKISNSINSGSINAVGSNSNYNVASGSKVIIKAGGIIGEVNNQTSNGNSLYYVTNEGSINGRNFPGKGNVQVDQYLGGIFGDTIGYSYRLVAADNKTIVNGRWENKGNITGGYTDSYSYYYTAGIGVASTSATKADFSYMINTGGYSFTDFNFGTHNKYIYYAATIIDRSSGGIRLSRAYNEKEYVYTDDYFTNSKSIAGINQISIAPFFTSITNNENELLYCVNNGDITVGNTSNYTQTIVEMKVAGITLATKVDYKNVTVTSKIKILKINQGYPVYVAGITWIIPYDVNSSKAYTMTNAIFEGLITTADISGNTELSNISGTSSSATSFSSNLLDRNLYVAALVNINVGIISNSINYGEITSTDSDSSIKDIVGTSNTFVGGIATFNYNFIRDSANLGNIIYTNSSSSSTTHVAGGINPADDSSFGGLAFAYNGGLVLGGISAAFGDLYALVLEGYGRQSNISAEPIFYGKIYDTSNNGNIYGKAKSYVRSGGILGIALGTELASGTNNNMSYVNVAGKFSKYVSGSEDTIGKSELSNGLNFGYIYAVTEVIGEYSGLVGIEVGSNSYANAQRPGIHSAAGGVIGYGLCTMTRMLNHGVIAATDVAGGIVGSTYILGRSGTSGYNVTIVNIDTAVHYGRVKALRAGTAAAAFNYSLINDFLNKTYFYLDDDTEFIFPASTHNLSIYPNKKRGFGGIFGRLQRGYFGLMESNNFKNVMNMDPNIDLVGRADQQNLNGYRYYRFTVDGKEDTYYTARSNDTTPAAFAGYHESRKTTETYSYMESVTFTIARSGSNPNYNYNVTRVNFSGGAGITNVVDTRRVGIYIDPRNISTTTVNNNTLVEYNNENISFSNRSNNYTVSGTNNYLAFGLSREQAIQGYNNSGRTMTLTSHTLPNPYQFDASFTNDTDSQYFIERITDKPGTTGVTDIFSEDFPLMDPNQSDFIYKANNDVLADRFRLTDGGNYKQYGMYVLASRDGREKGAVLPANINISKFFKLNEAISSYVDFNDIAIEELTVDNALVDEYKKMFQIRLNDKSLIVPDEIGGSIADIVFIDPTGESPILQGGLIDNSDHTITYKLSRDAFSRIDGSLDLNVYYQVANANLSANAVIAKPGINSSNYNAFYYAYNKRTDNIIRFDSSDPNENEDFTSVLEGTVVVGNSITIGNKLTVYSEIAANVGGLIEVYKTDYTIIIECVNAVLGVTLDQVVVNDTPITPPDLIGNKYDITIAQLLPKGIIEVVFRDSSNNLPVGHNLTFSGLYLGNILIDSNFYTYDLRQLATDNFFGFTAYLSDELVSGSYIIKYKYYNNAQQFEIGFTKSASNEYNINSVDYDTFSSDSEGDSMIFMPTNSDFISYIEFGMKFIGIPYLESNKISVIPEITKFESREDYSNQVMHYLINIESMVIATIKVSPFATLQSVDLYYDYNEDGIRQYFFIYNILSENDKEDIKTINQTIEERSLPALIAYKNGNREYGTEISVTREALQTSVLVDFGFYSSILNNQVSTKVLDGGQDYLIQNNEIEFLPHTYYEIRISYKLGTGLKEYKFYMTRDGVMINIGSIIIDKLLGTSAYLQDINFQLGSTTFMYYPTIYEVNSLGVKVTSAHNTNIYYDGIDYNDADTAGVSFFRIDGKLSDIDLEIYAPEFNLPIGATIERWDPVENSWTSSLETDFIGNEVNEAVIKYKITSEDISEDNKREVYYYITAMDILYNVTLRFNIYYQYADGTIVVANVSPLNNGIVIINVKNFKLKEKDGNGNNINYNDYLTVDPITGEEAYPFEDSITEYLQGLNNHSTLFYFPSIDPNYIYNLGRNQFGAYGFSIIPPVYKGENTENLINGKRYLYDIYVDVGLSDDNEAKFSDIYKLPKLGEDYQGLYFYVQGSLRPIFREFSIVIREQTPGGSWGLDDNSGVLN
jgi:hypothetical protein